MRRHIGQRSYTRPIMMTEYQEKFLPPRCHTAQVLGSKNNHLYQQLKALKTTKDDNGMMVTGTNNGMSVRDSKERTLEIPSFKSFYMAHKWINHPSKLPTVSSSCPRRCCCAQFCPLCKGSKEDDLTVYKRDYQAWKLSKRQPYQHHDNLKVYQGIGVADADKERQPIENTTSYKSSYIPHPVQPRKALDKPVIQTSHLQLGQPKCCGHCMADPCHGMVHHFNAWALETKFPSPGKDKFNPNKYLSTTHADYTPHKLQRTKPIMQPRQSQGTNKAPFEGTTTMKDDYREWDLPRRQCTMRKDSKKDWKKGFDQISFSMCASEANHCVRCHANHKHLDNTAAMSQSPVQNGTVGFECVAAGASGYLPGPMDGKATWMKCEMDKDQGSTHQMVSCMVSAQN